MLRIDDLPVLYNTWAAHMAEFHARVDIIDAVVRGDLSVVDQDEDELESRSPNMIQVMLEDTSEAAAIIPTLRAAATKKGPEAKRKAAKMESIGWSYLETAKIDLLIPRLIMDTAAYGRSALLVYPDMKQRIPIIERRDPRNMMVDPGFKHGDAPRRVMFAQEVYMTSLPDAYRAKVEVHYPDMDRAELAVQQVIHVEYWDDTEVVHAVIAQVGQTAYVGTGTTATALPILLERMEHGLGTCPIVIGERQSLEEGEARGQFDQVVSMYRTHIQLAALMFDYADQAVYSDIWVRDLIGEMPYGGGAFIELGPNGAIGRVPPAVSSLSLQGELAQLIDGMHLGGRWPKSRPGEVDQAIASAKFLEASAGVMNTAIRTYHNILKVMLASAVRLAFEVDVVNFSEDKDRMAVGVLRNQEFATEYTTKDIDLSAKVRIEYGLGLGRDPAQSAVLHIQYSQNEFVSKEFAQENIDGLTDVGRERARIDVEKFRGMALAKILQGVEGGMVSNKQLMELAKDREDGKPLWELFEEYIVKPEEEAAAGQVDDGFGGGLPGQGPGGAAPPPAPGGTDLLARINSQGADGATIGSQALGPAGPAGPGAGPGAPSPVGP